MKVKEIKGITLIALAITVVVLIILAGVSINAVVGDDGIIKKAHNSANLTRESEAKEIINRAVLEFRLTDGYDTLEDFLKTKVSAGIIDSVINNGDGTLNVSKNGYTLTVENKTKKGSSSKEDNNDDAEPTLTVGTAKVVANSDGTGDALGEASTYLENTLYITFTHSITEGTTTVEPDIPYAVTANGTYKFTVTGTVNGTAYTKEVSVTVNQFKNSILEDINIKIGDSVNYTPDTENSESTVNQSESGMSEQKVAKDTTLKWKILNIDEAKGTVDLVSAAPTRSTVKFYGALGYHNGPYIMNKICEELYSNSTLNVKARNINLLDMEQHLTPTGIAARNKYKSEVKYGTTMTYTDHYSYYPLLYAGQKGAGVNVTKAEASTKITQPNVEVGNDPYSESVKTTSPLTDKTYKKADKSVLTVTQTYYSIPISPANYGDAASVLSNSTDYWVAARYVDANAGTAVFGFRSTSTYKTR